MKPYEVVHATSVLASIADCEVLAAVPGRPDWCERLAGSRNGLRDGHVAICSVPFTLYEVSIGDVFSTRTDDHGRRWIDQAVTRSGHVVLRIDTTDVDDELMDQIREACTNQGGKLEFGVGIVAVDFPDRNSAVRVINEELLELESTRGLSFEIAWHQPPAAGH